MAGTIRQFELKSDFEPTGDQPGAIGELLEGIGAGEAYQTLLGVTGSGKTFTMAHLVGHRSVQNHFSTRIDE